MTLSRSMQIGCSRLSCAPCTYRAAEGRACCQARLWRKGWHRARAASRSAAFFRLGSTASYAISMTSSKGRERPNSEARFCSIICTPAESLPLSAVAHLRCTHASAAQKVASKRGGGVNLGGKTNHHCFGIGFSLCMEPMQPLLDLHRLGSVHVGRIPRRSTRALHTDPLSGHVGKGMPLWRVSRNDTCGQKNDTDGHKNGQNKQHLRGLRDTEQNGRALLWCTGAGCSGVTAPA